MGSNASSQRRKSVSNRRLTQPQSLDRDQPERRSLRSLTRNKSHAAGNDSKILRTSSNQSLPVAANRPVTLYNASQAELSDVRLNLMTRSPADQLPSSEPPVSRTTARPKSRAGTDSPARDRRSATTSPDARAASSIRLNMEANGLNSPFSVITSQELLDTDDDYRSVSDFLSKMYSPPEGQASLTRVSRINERICRETPETPSHRSERRHQYTAAAGRSSFSLCDTECNRSHATARDELNELNMIEYKLNCLMSQDRRRSLNQETGKSLKVSFTLSNGSQQESHMVSLSKASSLIAERKSYLEKKIELESSHCHRVKQILTNSHTCSPVVPSNGSQPPTPTGKPNVTLTSTPSFSKTRKPRALSLIESADGIVGLDSSSYANLMQDVKDVKTLLFRLQGLIHIAESDEQRRMSMSHMEEDEEEEELARQVAAMQQELRDVHQGNRSLVPHPEDEAKSHTKGQRNGRGKSGTPFEG